ncbi:hypothetical protein D3C84_1045930 [compost metagenome]
MQLLRRHNLGSWSCEQLRRRDIAGERILRYRGKRLRCRFMLKKITMLFTHIENVEVRQLAISHSEI